MVAKNNELLSGPVLLSVLDSIQDRLELLSLVIANRYYI
jgi:hypothetical protein